MSHKSKNIVARLWAQYELLDEEQYGITVRGEWNDIQDIKIELLDEICRHLEENNYEK
jgi:hypothetical protein